MHIYSFTAFIDKSTLSENVNYLYLYICCCFLQTCYEMERYLKDEPKLQSYKKLPTELDNPWHVFVAPATWKVEVVDTIDEPTLDSLSLSSTISAPCSRISCGSLSCDVLLKKEPLVSVFTSLFKMIPGYKKKVYSGFVVKCLIVRRSRFQKIIE